jgi:hypothetical protein
MDPIHPLEPRTPWIAPVPPARAERGAREQRERKDSDRYVPGSRREQLDSEHGSHDPDSRDSHRPHPDGADAARGRDEDDGPHIDVRA